MENPQIPQKHHVYANFFEKFARTFAFRLSTGFEESPLKDNIFLLIWRLSIMKVLCLRGEQLLAKSDSYNPPRRRPFETTFKLDQVSSSTLDDSGTY